MNAHKKTLDVWLNYRCTRCACPWKRPIIERRPVGTIDPDRLEAFFRDDPSIARALAFDVWPVRARALREPIRDGQRIWFGPTTALSERRASAT